MDELLKPLDEDILSSTLKASVGKDEILVTGGYQTSDGKYQFAMVEPVLEHLADGSEVIQMQTRHYSITPEVMNESELNSLSTNAGNTIQHGEIWTAIDISNLHQSLVNMRGVDVVTTPQLTVVPGREAEINLGGYRMSTTPEISEDGSGFDIELRIEHPRELAE